MSDTAKRSWAGIATVARLELRQRVRSPRIRWAFAGWLVLVYGIVGLAWLASRDVETSSRTGMLFGVITFFVLALAMLVVPALSAASVNGDRERGVLATLQTTLLTPVEIALGKLLAAVAGACALLVVVAPVWIFALASGGIGIGRFLLSVVTIALTMACICSLGLMFSTLTARSVTSTVATYLAVGFLVIGTLVGFGVLTPLTKETGPHQVSTSSLATDASGAEIVRCQIVTEERDVYRTDRLWGLLALNPFVVVADAGADVSSTPEFAVFDPLREIARAARSARSAPADPIDECWSDNGTSARNVDLGAPVWPVGFVLMVSLTALGTWVTIRGLRTPVRILPRGTRIA